MNNYPKISIVTPNYNGSEFLEQTMRSILDQGYPNLEYIVMDDGSSDRSVDIIRAHAGRLAYWETHDNIGQYQTINMGFEHATGEIMAWLNSDDILLPDTLFKVAEWFTQRPCMQWVTGWHAYADKEGRMTQIRPVAGYDRQLLQYGYYDCSFSHFMQQEGTFWRQSLWLKAGAGLDPQYTIAADYELWMRLAEHAECVTAQMPLALYRRHGTNRAIVHRKRYLEEARRARLQKSSNAETFLESMPENMVPQGTAVEYDCISKTWMFNTKQLPSKFKRLGLPLLLKETEAWPEYIESLVLKSLEQLFRKFGKNVRIALYGAGAHSAWLLYLLRETNRINNVVVLFDDQAETGQHLSGIPVVQQVTSNKFDVVIPSSDVIENELCEAARQRLGNGLRLWRLYSNIGQGPFPKKAYNTASLEILRSRYQNVPHVVWPAPASFNEYTVSRRNHMELFLSQDMDIHLHDQMVEIDSANLKRYQDYLVYAYMLHNVPKGARILEVGGGNSRILRHFSKIHECWNIDKLEGLGNGPKELDTSGYRLVRDYIGNFNPELPNNYFDLVFSISALEHVPCETVWFKAIVDDISRVTKPGGWSLHLLDCTLVSNNKYWINPFLKHMFDNCSPCNIFIPPDNLFSDETVWYMCEKEYQRWFTLTNKTYKEFGRPISYNILWQKPDRRV